MDLCVEMPFLEPTMYNPSLETHLLVPVSTATQIDLQGGCVIDDLLVQNTMPCLHHGEFNSRSGQVTTPHNELSRLCTGRLDAV